MASLNDGASEVRGRALVAVVAAALLLWAWVCVPVIGGQRTFFLRDVFTTHLPFKAFGAAALRHASIPAFNTSLGLGYPFRGNPNALPFYPGNLIYLALPFWSAFNLHYALHWLLAFLAMSVLARGLGQGRAGALVAGLTYAGSGWMLSALTFYNLLAVAAWWPLAIWGAVRGGRRGIAFGGVACGLAILGGEPVAAALGVLPLVLAAAAARGWRRGTASAAAVLALGLAVALPQLVATLRVLPFTVRQMGFAPSVAAAHALTLPRLLELVVPFPFGQPETPGPQGVWAVAVLTQIPLFLTLYSGLAPWLAGVAAPRHRLWALLATGGLAAAIAAGSAGPFLVRVSAGLFRYPEKFLFWFALALPLLAGWGVEQVLARERRGWRTAAAAAGAAALALAAAVVVLTPAIGTAAASRLQQLGGAQRAAALSIVSTQLAAWALALLAGGAALLAAAWAARRGRVAMIAGLQLALLLQLSPLVQTDSTAPYRQDAPWARRLAAARQAAQPGDFRQATERSWPSPGLAVVDEQLVVPPWGPEPAFRWPGTRAAIARLEALDLAESPGVLHGLTYPLEADLEGMQSPLTALLIRRFPRLSWPERARWFRSLGLDGAVLYEEPAVPELTPLDQAERNGVLSRLYAFAAPAPRAWWPRRLRAAASSLAAFQAVFASPDPVAEVTVLRPLRHDPRGAVRILMETPDRIELEVAGGGGVAVLRRAYQPLYRAHMGAHTGAYTARSWRAAGHSLHTLPVNLNLLGVAVPPGHHRVTVEVSAWPEAAAGVVAAFALAMALAAALFRQDDREGHRSGFAAGTSGQLTR